ncbi:transporter substrate-binding domain-containing protein [Marinobacterium lutimaris]|uniref:Amino acid ABC transporter substrate-binding protein, PAAT family n=1 Tax=Marinobacterium lutimaris TaxID=568106 RepID=A0A1H6CB38_9GAMM|nr:transporter substrate-binding domain-containing protein [Marinobacterium lutimaris]SEG70108.1 amino acid ABC transporter substrate-binding protein, PAAT family [Marinobacterium lutimaris]
MKLRTFTCNKRLPNLLAGVAFSFASVGIAQADTTEMPKVPDSVQEAGVLKVGTKCDYPPEGFLDNSGTPVGVEVSMAHQIAKYIFGDEAEAEIVCVTTSNRVPALLGGKIDLIIATMGITPERQQVVEFTEPYAWSSQGMVVRSEDDYTSLEQLKDKPVAFVKGALAIPYFDENYPSIERLQLDGVSNAVQALMTNRVEGYAHDTPILMSLVSQNSKIRLIDQQFKFSLRAAAVRPGNEELLSYVNSSLKRMAAEDRFRDWFEEYANDENMEVKLNFWDMDKKPNS